MKIARYAMSEWVLGMCIALALGAPSVAAEVTLTAIVSLPKNNTINTPFLRLIEEVNEKGKGLVKVRLVGGPEVMPAKEQLNAISRGVTDIYYGATAYFLGQIPEMTAFSGSNKTAMRLREEGQIDWLDQFFNEKVNAKLLGYYGSGYAFHIYLRSAPKRTPDGGVDLKGLKVRGSPSYAAQFAALGIVRVGISPAEIYTGLERGLLEGVGFPTMGVTDQGWEKFLKYRIFPTFKQGDLAVVMNLEKWNELGAAQRKFLQDVMIRYERIAHEYFNDLADSESRKFKAAGMKDVVLEGKGAERYLAAFYDTLWAPLEKKIGGKEVAEIRRRFYDPEPANSR